MKSKWLNVFLKISLSVIIVAGLYCWCCLIFLPKDLNDKGGVKYYDTIKIDLEEKDSLDIIMYGNSQIKACVIPLKVYKQLGVTSYLNTNSYENLVTIYRELKHDLKRQKPKVIILEVENVFDSNNLDSESWKYGSEFIAPYIYHTRWKELEAKDFFTKPSSNKDAHKGFYFRTDVCEYNYKYHMSPTTAKRKVSKSSVNYLKKIKKICDKNNIKLFCFTAPCAASWNMREHNGFMEVKDKLGLDYVDLNLELTNFDYYHNFRDQGMHCNFDGANVVTDYLINYISEHFNMQDKRPDPKYKEWNDLVEKYDQFYKY